MTFGLALHTKRIYMTVKEFFSFVLLEEPFFPLNILNPRIIFNPFCATFRSISLPFETTEHEPKKQTSLLIYPSSKDLLVATNKDYGRNVLFCNINSRRLLMRNAWKLSTHLSMLLLSPGVKMRLWIITNM